MHTALEGMCPLAAMARPGHGREAGVPPLGVGRGVVHGVQGVHGEWGWEQEKNEKKWDEPCNERAP